MEPLSIPSPDPPQSECELGFFEELKCEPEKAGSRQRESREDQGRGLRRPQVTEGHHGQEFGFVLRVVGQPWNT